MATRNEKRKNHRFSKQEVLLILRSYLIHPADFESILEEIKANVNQFGADIREMYKKEDEKRLLQRIREKFHRMKENMHTEKDSDIRQCLEEIAKLEKRYNSSNSSVNPPSSSSISSPSTKTTSLENSCQLSGTRNPRELTRPTFSGNTIPMTSSSGNSDYSRPSTSSLGNLRPSTSSSGSRQHNEEDTGEDEDQDVEDIRLLWAREDAVECERVRKRKKSKQKKVKKSRSTKELIRENEKLKNKLLTYLYKNKNKLVDVSSESSTSSESD